MEVAPLFLRNSENSFNTIDRIEPVRAWLLLKHLVLIRGYGNDKFFIQHTYIDIIYDTIYNSLRRCFMSQFDKLLKRILSLVENMRFDELRKILEA